MTDAAGGAPSSTSSGEALDYDRLMTEPPAGGLRRVPTLLWGAIKLVRAAAPGPLRWATALQAGNGILVAAQLLAVKLLLDRLLGGDPSFGDLLTPLLVLVAVFAVAAASAVVLAEQKRLVQELTGYHTTKMLLEAATSVGLIDLERPLFHDRLLRAQINAQSRPIQMVDGALGFLSAAVGAAGVAVALIVLQPLFLVIVMLAFAPAWVLVRRASRSTYRYTAAQARRDRRRSYLSMLLVGKLDAKEVRAYDLGPPLKSRHDRLYEERIADTRANVRERTRLGLVGAATTAGLAGLTVAGLAWYATSGRTSLATAGAATAALLLLVQRLQSLQTSLATLYESSLFIEDFTGFIAELQQHQEERPTTPAPAEPTEIVATGIDFRYPSSPGDVLHGVSLTVRRGEVVALVGENGSGKTTLAKILAGLFRPTGGTVAWDGVDLTDCDDRTIRDRVAVLFQDFSHFQLTLGENIELGRWTSASDAARRDEAVERAGLGDVVAALPRGVDTDLGPEFLGGIDLSGGQWQRLALAKALFRRAPFVILDEPTAALDPKAESELYERTRLLYAGSAVLLISHRLNSVRTADRIYVLDGGQVVEEGNHEELMEVGGVYADLFSRQAAGYVS